MVSQQLLSWSSINQVNLGNGTWGTGRKAQCVILCDPRIVTGELRWCSPEGFLVLAVSLRPAADPRLFLTERGDRTPCGSSVPRLVILTSLRPRVIEGCGHALRAVEGCAGSAGIWSHGGVIVTVNAGIANWRQGCPKPCSGQAAKPGPGDTVTVHLGHYSFYAEQ